MPRLTANVAAALGDYWNLVTDAAKGGYTSTDAVSAARDLAEQNDQPFSFQTGTAVSVLYGYARRMYNASQEVQNADDEDGIESRHIAIPPWARDEQAMNANPIWHVTYTLTTLDSEGNRNDEYKTSVFEYPDIPQSIGELQDAVTEDAQAMALKYGKTFLLADLFQILAV